MFLSLSCSLISSSSRLTIFCITSVLNLLNLITASILFLNSGVKKLCTALTSTFSLMFLPKPILSFSASEAPRLLVMSKTTLVKSVVLPVAPVNRPSSITCNNTCSTSGAAFSTSSNRSTQLGLSSTLVSS